MDEKALEYQRRAIKAEKELSAFKCESQATIAQLKKQNDWLLNRLAEAQYKLRLKDWTIREREEEADALRRELRKKHKGCVERGTQTSPQ